MVKFKNKENPCRKLDDGTKVWLSRSVVVVGGMFVDFNGQRFVCGVERGSEISHSGQWSLPCGYLDWNETLEQAMVREAYEETNTLTMPSNWKFFGIESDPESFRENVSVRFTCFQNGPLWHIDAENAAEGELVQAKWIDTRTISDYNWAFNHEDLIRKMAYER